MNDFILNGRATGSVASKLLSCNFDPRALRPYVGQDGHTYITILKEGKPTKMRITGNADATLRKDEWKILDEAVRRAAKPRLKAVAHLRSRGLTYNIPNGMGKTVLETQNMSDIGDASISMDAIRDNANDRPEFDLTGLPLPIIHKDFSYSARQIATSRNGGSPLDTITAELAAEKVAEEAEKMLLGRLAAYSFGGGTIYGYTNYPNRLTKLFTAPDASGWTGKTLLAELLAARKQLQDAYHYGTYMIYVAPAWDEYLDADYSDSKGDNTLRERILKTPDFEDVMTLDYLTGFDIIIVQLDTNTIREVIGMDVTTVQWEEKGGLLLCYKVMAIMVPQLRKDINDNTGILHGATVSSNLL